MTYRVTLNGKIYEVEVEKGEAVMVNVTDAAVVTPAVVSAEVPPAKPAAPTISAEGEMICSPLPGTVMTIKGTEGQKVTKGQVLVLIEAMKMENEVVAPCDGTIVKIIVSKGLSVETGTPLLTFSRGG